MNRVQASQLVPSMFTSHAELDWLRIPSAWAEPKRRLVMSCCSFVMVGLPPPTRGLSGHLVAKRLGCFFTRPRSSTVYQASAAAELRSLHPNSARGSVRCAWAVMPNPLCACPIPNASRLASEAR